jgi:hypothetical protein
VKLSWCGTRKSAANDTPLPDTTDVVTPGSSSSSVRPASNTARRSCRCVKFMQCTLPVMQQAQQHCSHKTSSEPCSKPALTRHTAQCNASAAAASVAVRITAAWKAARQSCYTVAASPAALRAAHTKSCTACSLLHNCVLLNSMQPQLQPREPPRCTPPAGDDGHRQTWQQQQQHGQAGVKRCARGCSCGCIELSSTQLCNKLHAVQLVA